jgi:hypothetical protein
VVPQIAIIEVRYEGEPLDLDGTRKLERAKEAVLSASETIQATTRAVGDAIEAGRRGPVRHWTGWLSGPVKHLCTRLWWRFCSGCSFADGADDIPAASAVRKTSPGGPSDVHEARDHTSSIVPSTVPGSTDTHPEQRLPKECRLLAASDYKCRF